MSLPALAAQVLATAQAALPAVTRTFQAGGPDFARVCTQLVVYAGPLAVEGTPGQAAARQSCSVMAVPQVVVVYSKDCYPRADLTGDGAPVLPTAADVTAWTADYLANVQTLHNALLDAALDGEYGECGGVDVGPTLPTGPTGGVCSTAISVTVRPLSA